jgi:hypothetical protein
MMSTKSARLTRLKQNDERGAVLLIVAFSMLVLLALAAFAVDFAVVRNDRTTTKRATDAASAAGALAFIDDGAEQACLSAVDYLALNGVNPTPATPIDCTGFPTSCVSGLTPSFSTSISDPEFTVTITHPVQDAARIMDPSALGTTVQIPGAEDGTSCDRFGVSVASTHKTFFAGVLDVREIDTAVHSVSLMTASTAGDRAINLLLLERNDCDVLTASGSGTGGGVSVGPVLDPLTGEIHEGAIILDSDGTGIGCGADGTLDVDGSNTIVQADGETGCVNEMSPGTGEGCGTIDLFASGAPGCNLPACTSTGTVAPSPDRSGSMLTRAPVDWIFNCKAIYPAALDIRGCPTPLNTNSFIDNLVAAVGTTGKPTPASDWQDYSPTYPCTVDGSPSTVVTIPEGNWRVNCNLSIKRTLIFSGGNVVFDGDVDITSSGVLDINGSNSTSSYGPGDIILDTSESSATAGFIFFRNGTLSKAGQASVKLTNVMTYLSDTSTVNLGGGSGAVEILAPTEGPFKNLAMWSESTLDHNFAGQSSLALEGVFFIPLATVNYAGNGTQQQVAAQFISLKLAVSGNGRLDIEPRYDRLVTFPQTGFITMIR